MKFSWGMRPMGFTKSCSGDCNGMLENRPGFSPESWSFCLTIRPKNEPRNAIGYPISPHSRHPKICLNRLVKQGRDQFSRVQFGLKKNHTFMDYWLQHLVTSSKIVTNRTNLNLTRAIFSRKSEMTWISRMMYPFHCKFMFNRY